MDIVLVAARLLIALVFTVAGVAKLGDRSGTRQALRNFGTPERLANGLGRFLPLAELGVALVLIPAASAWWGAVGALSLLLVFTAGIAFNLVRGRRPDCHCFGQIASGPAGWSTLARNGLLAAIAALLVARGPEAASASAVGWLSEMQPIERIGIFLQIGILAVVAVQSWLLVQLVRQNGRLLLRLDELDTRLGSGRATPTRSALRAPSRPGLSVGTVAPSFSLSGLHGETMTLDALRAGGKPVLLTFINPGCGPCDALLPELGQWQRDYAASFSVVLISSGTPEANRAKSAEHALVHVLLQPKNEIAALYEAYGTPSAVLVRPDGTIGSPVAAGVDAIASLVRQLVAGDLSLLEVFPPAENGHVRNGQNRAPHGRTAAAVRPTTIGEAAPVLALPDLSGERIELTDFRGAVTVVLFWNPGCGFCQQMLDDLKTWETRPSKGAPGLLVVSTGSVEANRAMGLRSPVVLEPSFSIGYSFGATGTPSAVRVDASSNVASPVAVGPANVLGLLGASDGSFNQISS